MTEASLPLAELLQLLELEQLEVNLFRGASRDIGASGRRHRLLLVPRRLVVDRPYGDRQAPGRPERAPGRPGPVVAAPAPVCLRHARKIRSLPPAPGHSVSCCGSPSRLGESNPRPTQS